MTRSTKPKTIPSIRWKPEPDGLGLFYGALFVADDVHTVDLLPPKGTIAGALPMKTVKPDRILWIGFIDGVEIVRASSRAAVEAALLAFVARCVEAGAPL